MSIGWMRCYTDSTMSISCTHSIGHAAGSQDRGAWPWRR
jgi:hypothetical protein